MFPLFVARQAAKMHKVVRRFNNFGFGQGHFLQAYLAGNMLDFNRFITGTGRHGILPKKTAYRFSRQAATGAVAGKFAPDTNVHVT
jgi:hypothetical protein